MKETIAKIRRALGEDVTKVEMYLKEIEGNFTDLKREVEDSKDTIRSVNEESKGRKLKLREKDSEIEELNDKVKALESDTSVTELKTENEQLKAFKTGIVQSQRTGFINSFGEISKHPKFEKVKNQFNIPEGEKPDWSTIEDDKMEMNYAKLKEYQDIGYFDKKGNINETPPGGRDTTQYENPFKILDN